MTAEQLAGWKAQHPGAVVVMHVNTGAQVKALTEHLATSPRRAKGDHARGGGAETAPVSIGSPARSHALTPPSTALAVIPAGAQHLHRGGCLAAGTGQHDRPLAGQRRKLARQLIEWDCARARNARQVNLVSPTEIDHLHAPVL
jgi:hypothetical protein